MRLRLLIGCWLMRLGMAVVPTGTREMARNIMLYHVPGMLTENEKAQVRAAKAEAGL